ncbi:MAG: signal peptide peptidase SppA [Gemmatimonadaceae bacterium]|nr:signal peptide peptidase SppA [Gemmatimonadaceae bacterium]
MKAFFTAIAANLVTIALCVVGGFLLIIGLVAAAAGDKPVTVRKGAILVIDLDQTFVDAPTAADHRSVLDDALLAGGANTVPLRGAILALREAGTDDNITGVLLRGSINPSGYGSGYAALRELRQAIADFRTSKKPVHAYLVNPETRDYYLASAASVVTLDPFGALTLPGLSSEQVFFAGMLEKYGIGVQVSRVGRFKAAVEPYTRTSMSPENRLQTRLYIDEMWGEVKRGIASSRGIDTTTLQTLVDANGILLPADAKKAGLVDRVAYFDEVLGDLETLAGVRSTPADSTSRARAAGASDDGKADAKVEATAVTKPDASTLLGLPALPQIALEDYAPIASTRARMFGARQSVAVIYAEGDIVDGQGSPGSIGGDALSRDLRRVRGDASIKAVVLRVNSPGGSAIASEKIQRELALMQRAKPVVVSMGTVAASGGYWIATAASRVFAQPNTITGSIGVFSLIPNVQQIAAKNGITFDSVKTGRYADIYTLSRPRSDDELAVLQRGTDAIYEAFITRVSTARKLTPDSVRAIAEGRVWSGTDAMRIGLVDSIGGLDAAITSAAALAKLTGDYDIREYPLTKSAAELLSEMFERKPEPLAALATAQALRGRGPAQRLARDIMQQVGVLLSFDDPRGVYARLPFVLTLR